MLAAGVPPELMRTLSWRTVWRMWALDAAYARERADAEAAGPGVTVEAGQADIEYLRGGTRVG